eukprot:CAMPEP_0172790304 /NCGR_PEP_ID=MMETSP1074-20121228/207898_1 /TAXON_ID=2916 /ORGANISM="Ceratium fusus, Strain PA161109" /LENGTH=183 /DNA_ID=CAMNT_0013627349 /DNA_START=25 /DNA_END=576 /DNA_ORIENTATION=-
MAMRRQNCVNLDTGAATANPASTARRTALVRSFQKPSGARFIPLMCLCGQKVAPDSDDEEDVANSVLPEEAMSAPSDAAHPEGRDTASDVMSHENMSTSLFAPRSSQEGGCLDGAHTFDEIRKSVTEVIEARVATRVMDDKQWPPRGVTKFGSGTGFCRSPNCIGCQQRRIERQRRELGDASS